MASGEALMLECQGGSRAAFEELFARYRKPLHGFFGRRLNNPERAENLAQETFLAGSLGGGTGFFGVPTIFSPVSGSPVSTRET